MKYKVIYALFWCLGLYPHLVAAQPAKVDSILSILQAAPKQGRVDTIITKKINSILNRTTLTQQDVQKIVTISESFKTGTNEDMAIRICYLLYNRLANSDLNSAIDFGKLLLARIEKSKTPEKTYHRNILLVNLRIPFRNSARLTEGLAYYNNYLLKSKEENASSAIEICHYVLSGFYRTTGLFDRAIYHAKKSLTYLDPNKGAIYNYFGRETSNERANWITRQAVMAEYFYLKGDFKEAVRYNRIAFDMLNRDKNQNRTDGFVTQSLAKMYFWNNQLDSAAYFLQLAYDRSIVRDKGVLIPIFQTWSLLELKNRNFEKADSLVVEAWKIIKEKNIPANSPGGIINPDYYRALIRIEQKKYAEATGWAITKPG